MDFGGLTQARMLGPESPNHWWDRTSQSFMYSVLWFGGSVLRGAQCIAGAVGGSDTLAGTQMVQTRLAL